MNHKTNHFNAFGEDFVKTYFADLSHGLLNNQKKKLRKNYKNSASVKIKNKTTKQAATKVNCNRVKLYKGYLKKKLFIISLLSVAVNYSGRSFILSSKCYCSTFES